jgi:hypothetical protein
MVSVSRGMLEPSSFLVVVADNGESIEKSSGSGAALSLSLYTKAGAAGNWPKGRQKVHKFKELAEGQERGRGAGEEAHIPLDNCRDNEYYGF